MRGLATLLVLADGRLPAGGHAHSGGVEAAVTQGRVTDLATLESFLRGRLATAGLVTASFAAATTALAPGATTALAPGVAPRTIGWPYAPHEDSRATLLSRNHLVGELGAGYGARVAAPALRRVSLAQGRALMRVGRAMWKLPDVGVVGDGPHYPIALGIVAAAAGLSPADAALVAAYGAVSGPASAAVRVLALDPYPVQGLLARLAPACDDIARRAAAHANDAVDDLPSASAPLLDISAEAHATWEVRLFAS